MTEFEKYEEFYYSGQVEGRGIVTPEQLHDLFSEHSVIYGEFFGHTLDHLNAFQAIDLACG